MEKMNWINQKNLIHKYGVRRLVAAFLSTTRFFSQTQSGDKSPHSIFRIKVLS